MKKNKGTHQIDIVSDSIIHLKKAIDLCFIDSSIKVKSFRRVDDKFVFYKEHRLDASPLKDRGRKGIYNILINYLDIHPKYRKVSNGHWLTFEFELSSEIGKDEVLSVELKPSDK